jgi:hypothetical protein
MFIMNNPGVQVVTSGRRARAGALILVVGAAIAVACATGGGGASSGVMAGSDQNGSVDWKNLPMKHAPEPTSAAITARDLMTRLYIFADDSMQGRQVGREGNMKGTNYIAKEAARLGLLPAGDNGTYFQGLPYVQRHFLSSSTLTVNGRSLRWNTDFAAVPTNAAPRAIAGVQAIYGGVAGDTTNEISDAQAAGKLVILSAAPAGQAGRGGRGGGRGAGGGGGGGGARFADAAAIATVDLQTLSMAAREAINNPQGQNTAGRGLPPGAVNSPDPCATAGGRGGAGGGGRAGGGAAGRGGAAAGPPGPPQATFRITPEAAALLLGAPVAGMRAGTTGGQVSATLAFEERPVPQYARNVVAIIRGSDPRLAGEYIAIGGHNDHIGFRPQGPVDHDSLRAWNTMRLMMEMQGNALKALTPEQTASIKVNMDSLRRIRPARLDSINNGADDDGSGSMAVLEIAEAIAAMPVKPKRSILIVWHTGEEGGLTGSNYFTANPTVPRDSIVAQLNIDMIGRGDASDMPGGNEDYVAVVGSKRLSTELGVEVAAVNERQPRPLRLDYQFDGCTDWPGYNNIYGRSDHFNYARFNIPIAFFFTGLHQDYHQVTDEPQYIDYPHYARITNYIKDLLVDIADRPNRLVVDKAVKGG